MPGLVDNDYVSMTLEFRCNLACQHCMIEGTMDHLQAEPLEKFEELLAYNARQQRWSGLIMTGSEITLRHDLRERIQARAHPDAWDAPVQQGLLPRAD